jgi:hypothetical protein
MEAEYRAITNGMPEATYLCQLLDELQHLPSRCTIIYRDNISDVYLSTNPVSHKLTKHMKIHLHFVKEGCYQSISRTPCSDDIVVH